MLIALITNIHGLLGMELKKIIFAKKNGTKFGGKKNCWVNTFSLWFFHSGINIANAAGRGGGSDEGVNEKIKCPRSTGNG